MSTDFRDYLDLESSLSARLMRVWKKYAASQYAEIAKLVKAKDWDAAYEIANAMDITDLVKTEAPFVQAVLKTTAVFGAKMAGDGKALAVGTLSLSNTMDQVTDNFLRSVEWSVGEAIRSAAVQSIAQAKEQEEKVKKAATPRFLREFVEFKASGDRALQLVSSLHTSRLSTWGFTAEAEFLNITEYELTAILDGRTSEFCRMIHGKRFQVADARSSILQILSVQDPADVKTLQPWPKQTKGAIEAYSTMSVEQLTAQGLHIPPFHPFCRTMLVAVGKAPKLVKPKIDKLPEGAKEVIATEDDFKVLGLTVSPEKVEHWNAYVKLSPVDVLAKLSGFTPKDVVSGELGKRFKTIVFDASGDISFRFRADVGTKSSGKLTFNPYSGILYQNRMDFLAADKVDAYRFVRQFELNKVALAQAMAATELVTQVGFGQAVFYGQAGYLPTPEAWSLIRKGLLEDIKDGLAEEFAALPKKERTLIMLCLGSNDQRAFRALTDVDTPFITTLLDGVAFSGHLDITDGAVVAKHLKGMS